MPRRKIKRIYHAPPDMEPCPYCRKEFGSQGFPKHLASCPARDSHKRQHDMEEEVERVVKRARHDENMIKARSRHQLARKFLASLVHNDVSFDALDALDNTADEVATPVANFELNANARPSIPEQPASLWANLPFDEPAQGELPNDAQSELSSSSSPTSEAVPRPDDIRVRYNPKTGRAEERFSFEEYRRDFDRPRFNPATLGDVPWAPFASREDFELAELCLDAGLSKTQVDTILSIIGKVKLGTADISFTKYSDVESAWITASTKHAPFEQWTKTFPYKGTTLTYEFFAREIWKTAKELVKDPALAPYWSYDAMILEKWNAKKGKWERIYDEPVTADGLWKAYANIPAGGTPFAIYLYADKTRLSSFGTQQGYPIVMRLPQLDSSVRNGSGYGGGIVVGFLPLMKETAKDSDTAEWKELKGAVWHEGFSHILDVICKMGEFGEPVLCGDGVERVFYLILLILSADYEEQCMMALTRSASANFPCPVCLVHKDDLTCLTKPAPLRTHEEGKKILAQTHNKTQREAALQAVGLRNAKNSFWDIPNFNVHQALSFDRLHSYHSGLFGHHLFGEFKAILESMGPLFQGRVDENFSVAPRWPDLTHFDSIANVSFTDGSKYEDISKLIIFASCSVMTKSHCPDGYALLILIRAWIELDILMSFAVHTDDSIDEIERGLKKFENALAAYEKEAKIAISEDKKVKSWHFPKVHMHKHAPDDIRNKGATPQYNTKPNERAHRKLKQFYLQRSNYKNVESTLAKLMHYVFGMADIRMKVDSCDDYEAEEKAASAAEAKEQNTSAGTNEPAIQFKDVKLGAPEPSTLVWSVELGHSSDAAFTNFGSRLQHYLRREFAVSSTELIPSCSITEYRYLKVDYECLITWKQQTDCLRCSPLFFNYPRYDSVIYQHSGSPADGTVRYALAQLVFVFQVEISDTKIPLALVTLMDSIPRHRRMDQDLSLYRVRARPRANSSFIPVRSIVHGAYLYHAAGTRSDFFVVDTLDADMFRRVRSIFT